MEEGARGGGERKRLSRVRDGISDCFCRELAVCKERISVLEEKLEVKTNKVEEMFSRLLVERDNVLYWVKKAGGDVNETHEAGDQ